MLIPQRVCYSSRIEFETCAWQAKTPKQIRMEKQEMEINDLAEAVRMLEKAHRADARTLAVFRANAVKQGDSREGRSAVREGGAEDGHVVRMRSASKDAASKDREASGR